MAKRKKGTTSIAATLGGAEVTASEHAARGGGGGGTPTPSYPSAVLGGAEVAASHRAAAGGQPLTATPPAGAPVTGPSVSESKTYRRAARQQARVIQKYAYNNEETRLEKKHYDFDEQGRVSKVKATREQIHTDLKQSRTNQARVTERLFGNPRVYSANVRGKVLGPKRIARIDATAGHRDEIQKKAAALKREANRPLRPGVRGATVAPLSNKKAHATAKELIHAKHHPYKGPELGAGTQPVRNPVTGVKYEHEYKPDPDLYKNARTGEIGRFRDLAPPGVRFVEDFVGGDPYAGALDPGNIATVLGGAALLAAGGGASAAARAAAVAKAAERVTVAERALPATEFAGTARGARMAATGAARTGEFAPESTRLGRVLPKLKARYAPGARGVRRAQRVESLAYRATNPVVGAIGLSKGGLGAAQAYGEALVEEPGKVLGTTRGVIGSMPAAMVAPFIDIATGHAEEAYQSLEDYVGQYGELFSGDVERAKTAIEENLGITPLITGGLGAVALHRIFGKGGAEPMPRPAGHVRRLVDLSRNGKTPQIRDAARRELNAVTASGGETLFGGHGGRKRGAERAAVAGEMETGQYAREQREGGKRAFGIGPRKALDEEIGDLNKQKLTEDATKGDVIRFLAATGIREGTKDVMGKLQKIRDGLREPSRQVSRETGTTRTTIDAIMAHPEVLADRDVLRVLDREAARKYTHSVERHSERTGKIQVTPDPLDEPARRQTISRNEGVLQPHERAPEGYEGPVRERPGQDFEEAVIADTRQKTKQAKAKRAKARIEDADARGAAKELNARKIADERRTAPRAINKKIRTLNRRLAAWTKKAEKAKTPETRKRYEAKVAQLKRQITETRATLTLSVSAKRLETIRRATEHKARANQLRAEADALEAQAKADLAPLHQTKMRRATAMEITAEGLRAKGEDLKAAVMMRGVGLLRKEVKADEARIRELQAAEIKAVREREGLAEPIYEREIDVSDRNPTATAVQEFYSARSGKKERFRQGTLAEEGRIDESALTLITNARLIRAMMTERWRQVDFMIKEALKVKGRRIFHQGERTKMMHEGKVPKGYVWMALQDLAQGVQRNDALRAEAGAARSRAIATAPPGERKLYILVHESAKNEHQRQTEALGRGWRIVRAAARLQTIGMLGTSPSWFQMQFPATLGTMLARNPNPVAWTRAVTRLISTWREMSSWERVNFKAHFGGNPADFLAVGENRRGIEVQTVAAMDRSARIAAKSTVAGNLIEQARDNKMLNAVWNNLRHGGPLISLNRKYESFMRQMMAMLEMDRLAGTNRHGKLRLSARPKEFIASTAKLHNLVREDLAHLKGKSYAEQTRFYLDNPKRLRVLENAVNDAYGNWTALASWEKKLASVTVFYPFVRFSLRWLFWSFPKNNPVKAAIYLNMAQKNADELEEFLGGPPSFFQDFGKIITHTGEGGAPETFLNLGRIAPGSNAVVESLGGTQSGFNLQTGLKPFQPVFGSVAAALSGTDQYGRPSDLSPLQILGKGITTLNPITRTLLTPKIAPLSDYSQLFKAVSGRPQGIKGLLTPDIVSDPESDQESARLGRMLEQASAAPSSSDVKAARTDPNVSLEEQKQMAYEYERGKDLWAKLDGYLVAYGITTDAAIKADDKAYEKSAKSGARFLARAAGEPINKGTEKADPFGGGAFDSGNAFGGSAFDSKAFEGGGKGKDVIFDTPGGGRKKVKAISLKQATKLAARQVAATVAGNVPQRLDTLYRRSGLPGEPPKYKLDQKMPKLGDGTAWAYYDPSEDTVAFSRRATRSFKQGRPGAVLHTLHEFAHSAQRGGLTKAEREGGADVFARSAAERMGIDTKGRLSPAYAPFRQQTRRERGPDFVGEGQFRAPKHVRKQVAKRLIKAARKAEGKGGGPTADGLNESQTEFGAELAKLTGLDPQTVGAWMLQEQNFDAADAYASADYHNYLNVQPTVAGGDQSTQSHDPQFEDPKTAAQWTYEWMKGNPDTPGGGAADELVSQLQSAYQQQGPEAQAAALGSSVWGTGDFAANLAQVSVTPGQKGKPIPKGLKAQAQEVLGKQQTRQIIEGGGVAAAPTAAAKPHLVKGFMKGVEISPGLPTAEDLGVKDGDVVLGDIHPELQKALVKLGKQTGVKPIINEGFRTESYQAFLAGTVSGPVAAPGQSHHESGLAVDVDNWSTYTPEQLTAAGLVQYVGPTDPEHLELINQPQALVGPMSGSAPADTSGTVPSSGTTAPSTAPATGGTTAAPSSGGFTPPVPGMKAPKEPKPKFSQAKLLKAIGEDQGFNALFGGEPAPPAEEDATMAAMAEIAATRKRLLKR